MHTHRHWQTQASMACVHMYLHTHTDYNVWFLHKQSDCTYANNIKSTAACTLNIKLEASHEYEVLMCIVYCHPCQFINQVKLI